MRLFIVHTNSGILREIECEQDDPLWYVINKFLEQYGISTKKAYLIRGGLPLENDLTIKESNIPKNAKLGIAIAW